MKLLRIKLPDQLHARLKLQAVLDQVSMQEKAMRAIEHSVKVSEGFGQINPALTSANPQKRGL